jgi:uncharacterized membrane protein YeaQ/YmgE (transglycosylase-associated protein family)
MAALVGWILFGLIAGVVARLAMPGGDLGGMVVTVALGVAGALVAGYIGRALGWYEPNETAGFITATLGAVLLLFVYRRVLVRG